MSPLLLLFLLLDLSATKVALASAEHLLEAATTVLKRLETELG